MLSRDKFLAADTECYHDYWMIGFLDPATDLVYQFEMFPGHQLDINGIVWLLQRHTLITFNGINYDEPMLNLALQGANCATLKQASDAIIVGNLKHWHFYDHFGIQKLPFIDTVDISEVAPGVRISLKKYGARMACRNLQDLPIEPHELIATPDRRRLISTYNVKDLKNTDQLRAKIQGALDMREALSAKYGVDMRSKSDAQIAEAIFKTRIGNFKRFVPHGFQFQYTPPPFIQFQTQYMRDVLEMVKACVFTVSDKDQVDEDSLDADGNPWKTGIVIPDQLKKLKVKINNGTYTMRIGGLHSTESKQFFYAVGDWVLKDRDVKSFYPSLILNLGLYPDQLGPAFLEIYREEYNTRLDAKDKLPKVKKLLDAQPGNEALKKEVERLKNLEGGGKILLNGTYGKLGSKYSILFAPELMLTVTLTGQLSLLMLIEAMENQDIQVISANTDGIVLRYQKSQQGIVNGILKWWEDLTSLETEETDYVAIFSRDVNNYVAFKRDGSYKAKGVFGDVTLTKDPSARISTEAAIANLRTGVPVEDTIKACSDIRKFIVARNVTGGATWNGQDLGKMVRWYYSAVSSVAIHAKKSGNKVSESDNAIPMMDLVDYLPLDLDRSRYVQKARDILNSLGVTA